MRTLKLTSHARDRMVEFGLGLDVVEAIASRPNVTHANARGEVVCTADAHPDWTVVLAPGDVVVTVLRRMRDRWEHQSTPARPAPSTSLSSDVEDVREVVSAQRPAVSRRRSTPPLRASSGVVRRAVDPEALRLAAELAEGDLRRLVLNDDGSVTVLNRARVERREIL